MRGQKSAACYFLWILCAGSGSSGHGDDDFRFDGDDVDYRTVGYPELLNGSDVFDGDKEDAGHFGQLLVDPVRSQLVVGGRDAVVRLDLEGLRKLETAAWPATDASVASCLLKGQTEDDCRNYIKILALHGDRLFACGTHAFGPTCSWRKVQEIRRVLEWVDGRGKCPYAPGDNAAALMTHDGDLYIGSATDFSSTDHAVFRMGGERFGDVLRTSQNNPLWLARPDFVGAFDVGPHVYFFFRETAVDGLSCGGAVHARVARVCKNDRGEPKGTWTTFLKARLRCSLPGLHGEPPFDFDHVRSVFYLEAEATFYATFATAEGAPSGSAVCGFALADVDEALSGPFKRQAGPDGPWGPYDADHAHFRCLNTPSPTSREFQLVDRAVLPAPQKPIYHEQISRFTHIVVDAVETKPHGDNKARVLFVADQTGLIKKISYDVERGEACVVEILHPFPKRGSKILSLKILPSTFSLYLGTENSVLRVPTHRCHRFATELACINAMDPYCGWNEQRAKCTTAPSRTTKVSFWKQNFSSCPILNTNVNGSWSQWSAWSQCLWNSPEKRVSSSSQGDSCVCRKRFCDSPRPMSGGRFCEGMDIEVTNCTQHGQWTTWSDWSDCSSTCDVGLRQRRRTCGNPAPAFGGKVCIGEDIASQTCEHLPSCSKQQQLQLDTNFKFTSWSEWSECSSECGKGFRSRTRSCSNVQNVCNDARTVDYSECESLRCPDTIKVFDYTPWVRLSYNDTNDWMERRFRFEYSVPASSSDSIKAIPGLVLSEDRTCRGGSSNCSVVTVNSLKDTNGDDWTEWSRCSRECGGGYQMRLNNCDLEDPRCFSASIIEQRICNTQPCTGIWGCWSSWTHCNSNNLKHRNRTCLAFGSFVTGNQIPPLCSKAPSVEESSCDGWTPWSGWKGSCQDSNDVLTRTRKCLANECGDETYKQTKSCLDEDTLPVSSSQTEAVSIIIVAIISGFLVGTIVGVCTVTCYQRYCRHRLGGGGNPHYLSAKSQNLYVSLPMLDLKNKHFSTDLSNFGTMRSTSTLSSKVCDTSVYNTTLGEYETATIKRSHNRNSTLFLNGMRADINSDSLFD